MKHKLLIFVLLWGWGNVAWADERPVRLVVVEQYPYAAESLPDQGGLVALVKNAFEKVKAPYQITFESEQLAFAKIRDGRAELVMPIYAPSPGISISRVMIYHPIALAQRRDVKIIWTDIRDLRRWRIGRGSQLPLTTESKQRLASLNGHLKIYADDENLIRSLAGDELDAAFIDSNLFRYLIATDLKLGENREEIQINPRLVDVVPVYFGINSNNPDLRHWIDWVLAGLDPTAFLRDYLNRNNF